MKNEENGNLRLIDGRSEDLLPDGEDQHSHDDAEDPISSGDFNLRVLLQAPARYLRDNHGEEKLRRIVSRAGLKLSDLDGKSNWASLSQVEAFFSGVRALVGSDEEFERACVYKLKESFGAASFVIKAMSPSSVYQRAASEFSLVSRISEIEVEKKSRNHAIYRYRSAKPESRLMCLSRQAQGKVLPTLWDLPPATQTETKCIAWGDDCCEFELRWYQHRRWLPVALGVLGGVAAAAGLWVAGLSSIPLWLVLPLFGGLSAYVVELRRANRANLAIGEEINDALRELARDDAESRREVVEFHKREREWAQKMERQVAERTATLEDVLDQVKRMHEEKRSVLRGFSHDLTNPFQMVYSLAGILKRMRDQLDPDLRALVDDQNEAVERMKLMLKELVETASTDAGLIRVKPERVDVPPLVEVLRRRARAFVRERDIRVSVFSTREIPSSIVTDRLVFDRVADNLLTNAAKYTTRGSIVVELDGVPGFLTLKVSDSGRGIADEDIERIFRPKGSDPERRGEDSHGVGLSVVVQLLGQIGGRLEVKSMPGKGTTFWAHFPEVLLEPEKEAGRVTGTPRLSAEELIGEVVNIRKSQPP